MTPRDSLLPRVPEGGADATTAAVEQSLLAARLTVFLARDGDEKARLLAALPDRTGPASAGGPADAVASERRELLAALRNPYVGGSNGSDAALRRAPLVLCAQDLDGSAAAVAALADRLTAVDARGSAIRHAVVGLEAAAAALLADDGGPIAQLVGRLRGLDDALQAARADEAAEQAQIEALLTPGAAAGDIERERDRLLAERDHWQALIRLWPDWQRLQEARRDIKALAKFERLPSDLDARVDAVTEQCERADAMVRAARHRRTELRAAREAGQARRAESLAQLTTDTLRLHEALPAYRSRLLQLAAVRARLAELERTLGAGLERLGGEREVFGLLEQLTRERRVALRRWQERFQQARAAAAAAEQRLKATRERLCELSGQAREELARECSADDADVDVLWRSVWQLRAHLEEIWEVQSRAEAQARTLRDREDALRDDAALRFWHPPGWMQFTFIALLLAAGVGGLWTFVLQGRFGLPLLALAAVFGLVAFLLYARTRWVGVLEQRRTVRQQNLRAEIERLRAGCDADWGRAARLTELMRQAVRRLALPESVTLEMVESREQELATQLREQGAVSELSAVLLALLDAQDEEPRCAAALADADAERTALQREWEAWRAEAGLPTSLESERIEEWVNRVTQLAAACEARVAAREELGAIEPLISDWEQDARGLLGRSGTPVAPELCGSALAAELSNLVGRVRADEDERRQRAQLDAALRDVEQRLADAEAECERAHAARQAVINTSRAGNEAGLQAQLDGLRRWRAARARIAGLEQTMDDALRGLAAPAEAHAGLARGDVEQWHAALRDVDAQLEQLREALARIADRRRTAEARIAAAAQATHGSDLQLQREEVLAELRACAREWQLRVLAASLLAAALEEQASSERNELLQHASRHLAALSGGRLTALVRAEPPAALAVVDRAGRRMPLDGQLGPVPLAHVHLSLVLGRAAQLAGRGASVPIVLDDALASLPPDEAQRAAQEIARVAGTHPVLYFTIPANRARILSALPSDVAVVEADA